MTDDERWRVWAYVENKGFDYCFRRFSDFADISDPKFHKLVKIYRTVAEALEEYVKPEDV